MPRPKKASVKKETGSKVAKKATEDQSSRIKELEAQLAEVQEREDLIAKLSEQNQKLMELVQTHRVFQDSKEEQEEDENKRYPVTSLANAYVTIQVLDIFGANKQSFRFEKKGATHMLTKKQIREVQADYPAVFTSGLLAAPEIVENNSNMIPNIGEFIDGLNEEDMRPAIEAIDSVVTLYQIFNFVENMRFGDSIMGASGIELEEIDIPIKYEAIEKLVKKRLFELRGIELGIE
jgi:hypothetical protein